MTTRLLGSQLHYYDQVKVKAEYTHRYTGEHTPAWVGNKPYPLQFADDNDWLAHTYFRVGKTGRLDRRVKYCDSKPTWPNGK